MISRAMAPEGPGQTHFNMRSLMNDEDDLTEALREGPYARKALVPASTWLNAEPPAPPKVEHARSGDTHVLHITPGSDAPLLNYVIYRQVQKRWSFEIVPAGHDTVTIDAQGEVTTVQTGAQGLDATTTREAHPLTRVAVSALDRAGNESRRTILSME